MLSHLCSTCQLMLCASLSVILLAVNNLFRVRLVFGGN